MFAVCGSSGSILFAVIWKKKMKQCMKWAFFVDEFISVCGNVIKFSSEIPSIDTDIFPPYYSYCV